MASIINNQFSALGAGSAGRKVKTSGTQKLAPGKILQAAKGQTEAQTEKNTGEAIASPEAVQKATYYSRPELGTFTEKLFQEAAAAEETVKAQYKTYAAAQEQMEAARTGMENWGKQVAGMREQYEKNPSLQSGVYLQKAQQYMQQLIVDYEEKKKTFDAETVRFEPANRKYNQAVNNYNRYIQNQQEQLKAWKGTIRDTDSIQADMDNLDDQIKEAQEQISSLRKLTWNRNDAFGESMKQSLSQSEAQLKELQNQRAMLQEEYDWSRLSSMGDIEEAEYFGKLSADERLLSLDLLELQSWTPEERDMLADYILQSDAEFWADKRDLMPTLDNTGSNARLTADALFEKYGETKVQEMAESLRRFQNSQLAEQISQAATDGANNHGGIHSALSVGANLLNSFSAPMGYVQELVNRTGRYSTLDPNNVGNAMGQYAGTVRGQVAQNISGDQYDEAGNKIKDGGILRQAGAELYGAGMSAADSLSRMWLGGGNKILSLGMAATGSFGSTVSRMSSQGATPGQAVGMGIIDGALEILTEKFSIDNLFDMAASGKQSAKQILKNLLVQGAVEVTEEEASFLGSTLAEAVIMREKSSYNLRVQELMDGGMTEDQAREIADQELWREAGQTAVQSFLSGGMMSGATSLYTNGIYGQIEKAEQKLKKPKESMVLAEGEVEGLSLPTPGVSIETTDRVKQAVIDQAGRLAKATGRNIVFYSADATENGKENGYYQDGTIYINTRSDDALGQIVSHELTHSAEFADVYQDLSNTVFRLLESKGINLQSLQQQKADLYAQNGHALKNTAEVNKEIVADFVGQYLLSDEQTILDVVKQNRTLGQRIVGWFDGLLAKLGNSKAQERVMLTNARNLWAKALEQTKNSTAATMSVPAQQTQQATAQTASNTENTDGGDIDWQNPDDIRKLGDELFSRGEINEEEHAWYMDMADQAEIENDASFSYAGKNARNANFQTLGTAQELERMGVANETIRQQTGWFKGMDGKWRFEVDDSSTKVKGELSNYMTLGELLEDAQILKEYPNLEDVSVTFQSLEPGVNASYSPQFDSIDVSYKLKNDPEAVRAAVLHEIQHAVQRWEGFTGGASVGRWDRKIREGFDPRRAEDVRKAQETEQTIRQVQDNEPGFYQEMMELNAMLPDGPRGEVDWETLEQITEDPPEWQAYDARREELEAMYGEEKVWDFMDLLYQQEKAGKNTGRTATELYWDTAGEIEARDVAARRNLSAEERKNTPPKLGDEDTVFAEGNGVSNSIAETDDGRTAVIVDNDILSNLNTGNWDNAIKEQAKTEARKAMLAFKNGVQVNGIDYKVNQKSRREFTRSQYTETVYRNSPDMFADKMRAADNVDEIITATTSWARDGGLKHPRKDNFVDFVHGDVLIQAGANQYSADTVVGITKTGEYVFYDIVDLNPTVFNIKKGSPTNTESDNYSGIVQGDPSVKIVPDDRASVKQFSITAADKRGIAGDLRSILSRGGNPAELRRYIEQLERGRSTAEQTGRNAEQNGAQRIIQEARLQGVGVEEHLRQNWEQYDVDGEWNEDARAALEQERQGRRYSISGTGEENREQKTAAQIREEMPAKARNYLEGKERLLLTKLGEKLGISKFQNRESLQELIREISDEFLVSGRIPDEKMDFLFDKGFAEGIIEDARFYNEYKDIKDHLRTTGVTLSQQDQADIADYNDFRRRAFGTVRIVKDGMPVDSAYHELHEMAPELFPESITHPADQLVRMYEVGQSIQVAEVSLQHYYGRDAEMYRRAGKQDFADTVNTHIAELRTVKKVAEEAAMKAAEKALTPTTQEEAAEAYKQLKDARRTYEKAVAKNLLSDSDEIQVGRLLKGEILPEHLDPDKDNIRAITAVYEAKQEYERLTKLIADYKTNIRQERQQKADDLLETANEWKDKKVGLAYSRETMERNIYDIVPDKAVAERVNREIFHPIHMAEAEATRFKNAYRDQVRALDLSRKPKKGNLVSEAHAVQLLGEAEDNIRVLQNSKGRMKQRDGKTLEEWKAVIDEMWRQSPDLNEQKIRNAVAAFRKIYDGLFQQMNEVRIRNGYEPVNYRQGYFPHFQPGDGDSVMIHFGKVLGIDTQVAALPTSINGMTHAFRPGIQWFGNAQERLGFNTAYDAVEGFDKYIEGVASVIHQTDNIQMLRAMESRIRYRTTDEGIRKQVDAVNADNRLTEEEKRVKINDIFEHGKYTLSNFVTELTEYTNLLANKKSRLDRTTEALIGRRAYTIMKNWESRVGANMIAGNISSALTNFIPLTQAGAQLDTGSMLKGMWDTLKSYKADDGFAGMSTFLTNRRGSDPLVQTWAQKASEAMKLNVLMDLVDGFTSDTIVRAAYNNNLKHGLSEAEAMYQADIFASNVMADRSKGAMPTLFESTNPIFKMFTQFQLEVNNQYSEVFKDLPRRHKEKGLLVMTGILLKYFIGAYLFNDLYEYFTGRRPALDPFGMLNDTVGDWTGYDFPNVVDWISGKDTDFTAEKVGAGEAMKNLASSTLSELPFSSGLTLLGIETDGGRVPASSAIPDLTALWDAATHEDWSAEKRWKEAQDELNKLAYIIPPFGGNQVQKIWKGVKAYQEGGSYNVDAEGKDILQYPVYNDEAGDFWSLVRAMIMGKSSLETAQDWVDSGFDSLSAKQTAVYQDMVAAGATQREAYALIQELQKVKKTETQSEAELKRDVLQNSDLPGDAKAVIYYGLFASDTEQKLMDTLSDMGAAPAETVKVLIDIADAGLLKGAAASNAKRDAIANADLTDQEKQVLYREKVSDSRDDEIAQLRAVGIDFNEFLDIHSKYTTINEKDMKATEKATEFSHWLDDQGYTESQKEVAKDEFAFFSMTPADSKKYDELVDSGMDPDAAYDLASSLNSLEPEDGASQVSNVQKWRECVDFSSNVAIQLAALRGVADDKQFTKIQIAYDFDVMPDSYVSLQEVKSQYDTDGNGSFTNDEMKAAVDSLSGNLSVQQKAALWQLATGNTSAKNNPYSREVGQAVIDAREAAKEQK